MDGWGASIWLVDVERVSEEPRIVIHPGVQYWQVTQSPQQGVGGKMDLIQRKETPPKPGGKELMMVCAWVPQLRVRNLSRFLVKDRVIFWDCSVLKLGRTWPWKTPPEYKTEADNRFWKLIFQDHTKIGSQKVMVVLFENFISTFWWCTTENWKRKCLDSLRIEDY